MNEPTPSIEVNLRVPGTWSHTQALIYLLPANCRLTPEALILPDGTQVEFGALDADDQFAQVFRSSCGSPATDEALALVDRCPVNVVLSRPGGSLQAARAMMQAGAALVLSRGAGVVSDNSGPTHGGGHCRKMTED